MDLSKPRRRIWSPGSPFGCAAGFIVMATLSPLLLFAVAWGGAHCEPVPACQREGERIVLFEFAVLLLAAGLIALLLRWVIDRIWGTEAADWTHARSIGPPILLTLATALVSVWLLLERLST